MEVIIGMRRIKRTNKVLVLLFLYDEEKYGEYVKEVRKRVVLPPRTPSNFEILTDILTSCVSTGRVEALKGLLPDLLGIGSLLSKREKELVRMVYSDIYKVFTPENPPDEFVDLEQVVFFWFITGEYSKILRVGERVCKKVLFVAYSRSRGEGGERERKGGVGERGDHSKDEIYKEDCIHTTPYSTAPYSTPPIPSIPLTTPSIPLTTPPIPLTPTIPYSSLEDANEMEKIGFSWKIENEFLKERVKFFLRMGDTKRVRETVEGVQGLPLLVEVLNVLREEKAFTLLRGIVLRLLEREKMVFTGKKVLLSFLHLKEIEIEVRERLRVIGGVCSRNSKVDGKWLYNNLVDVYNSKNRLISPSLNVDESIGLPLSLSLSIESFTISILLISPSNLPLLYKKFIKFTGGDSEEGGESVGDEGGESVGEEGGESVVRDSIRDSIREEVGDIPNLLPYSPNTNTNPNLSTSLIKILFYEAFLPLNPKEAEGILRGINLKEVEDSSLLYLLGLKEVERTVVLESHFRGVLLPSHLEGIIVRECLKGTLFLYDYLRSVVVIKIENYLTKESRAILTATLRMVEQLKSVEMILFFQRVVKE